jgi:predicted  nucleic acid-binding Zn-ribbon protein
MAITAQEKERCKQAQKARNAAFNVRRKAYKADMEKALKQAQEGPEEGEWAKADSDWYAYVNERDVKVEGLRRQVEDLQSQIRALTAVTNPDFVKVSDALNKARDAKAKAREVAKHSVQGKYPDMKTTMTAASWKPLDEFMPK